MLKMYFTLRYGIQFIQWINRIFFAVSTYISDLKLFMFLNTLTVLRRRNMTMEIWKKKAVPFILILRYWKNRLSCKSEFKLFKYFDWKWKKTRYWCFELTLLLKNNESLICMMVDCIHCTILYHFYIIFHFKTSAAGILVYSIQNNTIGCFQLFVCITVSRRRFIIKTYGKIN